MIYFETHATSLDNEAGIASGHNDVLSQTGESQARELGMRYRSTPVDRVLCSDLRRSWRTAEIAFSARGIPIVRDRRLRECSYGDWNGSFASFIEAERMQRIDVPFPNGQSLSECVDLVGACLADNDDVQHLLIVGHRATYYALRNLLDNIDLNVVIMAPWRWQPGWRFKAVRHNSLPDGRKRTIIESVEPEIDAGRFAAKRTIGDTVVVEADIFTDGHDALSAVLLYRKLDGASWTEAPMRPLVNDRWGGEFAATELGQYVFTIEAWVDSFSTWQRDMAKRVQAAQDAQVDYLIGAELIEGAATRASKADAAWLGETAGTLRAGDREQSRAAARAEMLSVMMARYPDRRFATRYERELRVVVDPVKARFSSWYELFPRSAAIEPGRHGTFADCIQRLPYVASMGFDVLYLPPIHPIGVSYRKGKNNAVSAEPNDVGSPWAIGAAEGGHKSIHPDLGTLEDFRKLVNAASDIGIDIALDIALQAAPDHPYVREHPEWFRTRPDGTIQYAENPPKKYQDIYPFDFETGSWLELWKEMHSIFTFWIEQGVRIFRVDNPHTKAFPFWEWVIGEIKRDHPEVLFLSEAFTRPKVMYRLAKVGFSQSYTYFPWRHTKWELTDYMRELTQTKVREYFRANHWPNTPDILTEFLQTSGRPGYMMRIVLAATLGANYGIYGPAFELMESAPRSPGSEEYLDSEKYQIRTWETERPDSLREFIALVNRIRKENPALHSDTSLRFHPIDNDQLIAYSKHTPDGSNLIVTVVNLDSRHSHAGYLELPLDDMRIGHNTFQAHELLTGARYLWSGPKNYVEIDPASVPAHIFLIRRRIRTEREFEYFL